MAITYTWKITSLLMAPSLDGLTDVVTRVKFDYTGTEDEYTATFNGVVPVGTPSPDNFTPLADLTEDEVIEWVKANHPTEHMDSVIEKSIANQKTPKDVPAPLPWAPPTEEIVEG
jgi:hypothetical protein